MFKATEFLKKSLKRALKLDDNEITPPAKRTVSVLELYAFQNIFDRPAIRSFLSFDRCNIMADKYLIAMALIYLKRAGISVAEYNELYFFSALFLAHEMEEDVEYVREKLIYWIDGETLCSKFKNLDCTKMLLWKNMKFKCWISREQCEMLIEETPQWSIWNRVRDPSHAGATRDSVFGGRKCKHCIHLDKPYSFKRLNASIEDSAKKQNKNNYENVDDIVLETSDWEVSSVCSDIDGTETMEILNP